MQGTASTAEPDSQATLSSSSAAEVDIVTLTDTEELERDEFHDRGHGEPSAPCMKVRIVVPAGIVVGSKLLANLPHGRLLNVHLDSAPPVEAGELLILAVPTAR